MKTTLLRGIFPELLQCNLQGYKDDFLILSDECLVCLLDTSKKYSLEEVDIIPISCTSLPATLILIETKDVRYRGTAVEFWETWEINY